MTSARTPEPPVVEAVNAEGTIARTVTWGSRVCSHVIPAEADRCLCGARRAYIVAEYQPVLA